MDSRCCTRNGTDVLVDPILRDICASSKISERLHTKMRLQCINCTRYRDKEHLTGTYIYSSKFQRRNYTLCEKNSFPDATNATDLLHHYAVYGWARTSHDAGETKSGFVFSKRQRITLRLLFAMSRPSVVCLSVVCLSVCLSVTLVHPTQAVKLFGNFFFTIR